LDEVAKDFAKAEAEVRGYSRSIRNAGKAHDELTTSASASSKVFSELAGHVKGLLGAAGIAGIAEALGSVAKNLTEIRNISAATGGAFSPQDVKIFQEQMEGAGVKTELARQSLVRFSDKLAEAREKGGKGPFDTLNVNVDQFGNKLDIGSKVLVDFSTKLIALQKTNPLQAMSIGMDVFGKQWSQMAIAIERLAESGAWDKIDAELKKSGRAITPETLARLDQYEAAWDKLGDAIESVFQPLVVGLFPEITKTIEATAREIEGLIQAVRDFVDWLKKADAWIMEHRPLGGDPNAGRNFGGGSDAPFAGGGYVSGPGGPTSDSILARLSDGEYVMRARAVERWGPQFMEMLNNLRNPFAFAQGGMVRSRRTSFASGGLVAGGGATVNLMFPGGSFALQADNAIVGSLTREARRAGMLQGGRRAGLLQ
jgi:hypothetical protein